MTTARGPGALWWPSVVSLLRGRNRLYFFWLESDLQPRVTSGSPPAADGGFSASRPGPLGFSYSQSCIGFLIGQSLKALICRRPRPSHFSILAPAWYTASLLVLVMR
jgi:hypothetical protein